jgi:hypothetical protein
VKDVICARAYKQHTLDICDDARDDQDFKTGRWMDISEKCPNFIGIIRRQYPSYPVPLNANYNGYATPDLDIRLILAFLGRLLFPLNLFDKFHKALAIIGSTGVGKTQILEFMQDFVKGYVFNLNNNPQEIFGFETAIGMKLCVVEEISSRSKIPGGMMLSMVCGTAGLPVGRKHNTQYDMNFKMPMFVTGNSFPDSWPNQKGN